MTSSNITGLILIDCWEPAELRQPTKLSKRQDKDKQLFYKNLVENLKNFNFVDLINASTHQIKTAVQVQDYLSTQSNVFVLDKQLDFFKLRKHKPWKTINHWLVVGTTWQVCAHLNDMGLCSFSTMSRQHSELNFYGAPWGFLKHDLTATTDEDFKTDLLTWTNVGLTYRLHPEIIDNLGQSTQHTQTDEIRNKYIHATPY